MNKRQKTQAGKDTAAAAVATGWGQLSVSLTTNILSFCDVRDVVQLSNADRHLAMVRTSAAYDAFWHRLYVDRFELESLEDPDLLQRAGGPRDFQRFACRTRMEKNWFRGVYTKHVLTLPPAVAMAANDANGVVLTKSHLCFAMHAVNDGNDPKVTSLHSLELKTGAVTAHPQWVQKNDLLRAVHPRGVVSGVCSDRQKAYWYWLGEPYGAERIVPVDWAAGEKLNSNPFGPLSSEGDRVVVLRPVAASLGKTNVLLYTLPSMELDAVVADLPSDSFFYVTREFLLVVDKKTRRAFTCYARARGWAVAWTRNIGLGGRDYALQLVPRDRMLLVTVGMEAHCIDLATGQTLRVVSRALDMSWGVSSGCVTLHDDRAGFAPTVVNLRDLRREPYHWDETFAATFLDRNWRYCVLHSWAKSAALGHSLIVLDFLVVE